VGRHRATLILPAIVLWAAGAILLSEASSTSPDDPRDGPPAATPAGPAAGAVALWRDEPDNPALVRIDAMPGISEPSDLLWTGGELYTISDSQREVYRIHLEGRNSPPKKGGAWVPRGLPPALDLEAMASLPGGEILLASETNGTIFVLSPFPEHACAVWSSGVDGTCYIGKANCGVEALAVLPDRRLFVAKERDPRGAWLFDLPSMACEAATLAGRTYLTLPEEVGPDISAATWDAVTGHLLLVARSRQSVLEFEAPPITPGNTSPRPLKLLGSFSYARTENALDYAGLDFHQVEGIAVDGDRTLYLAVDGNERTSRRLGGRQGGLLRFYAYPGAP